MNCRCISTPPTKEKKFKKNKKKKLKRKVVLPITNTFHLPALGLSTWEGGEGEERGTLTWNQKQMLIPWAVSERWYSEWSHSIRHFARISNKLFSLKNRWVTREKLKCTQSMVKEFEIADKLVFIKILLFSGFLFFPCCPSLPQKTKFKTSS